MINFKLCANKERNVTNCKVLLSSPGSPCFSDEERVLNKKAKSVIPKGEESDGFSAAVKVCPLWDIVYFFSVFEKRIVLDSDYRCKRKSAGSVSCVSVYQGGLAFGSFGA